MGKSIACKCMVAGVSTVAVALTQC